MSLLRLVTPVEIWQVEVSPDDEWVLLGLYMAYYTNAFRAYMRADARTYAPNTCIYTPIHKSVDDTLSVDMYLMVGGPNPDHCDYPNGIHKYCCV